MAKRGRRSVPDTGGEVWVRIDSYKRKYYISRTEVGATKRIDDEAQLEIIATIHAISPALKKPLGATMDVSLLSAQDNSLDGWPKTSGKPVPLLKR